MSTTEELCKQAGITYFDVSCDLEEPLPFEIERLYYKDPVHDSTQHYSFLSDEEDEEGELLPLRFATYLDAIAEIELFAKQKIEGNKRRAGLPWEVNPHPNSRAKATLPWDDEFGDA